MKYAWNTLETCLKVEVTVYVPTYCYELKGWEIVLQIQGNIFSCSMQKENNLKEVY